MQRPTSPINSARADMQDLRFLRSGGHLLRQNPALLFQEAANQPQSTSPARIAEERRRAGLETRLWLRWINKPKHSGAALLTLIGHRQAVLCCAFSPQGDRVLTGCADGALGLWDARTGIELMALEGHSAAASDCAYSPDGWRVLSASHDSTLRLWDSVTGVRVGRPSGAPRWSPDGRQLLVGCGSGVVYLLGLENTRIGAPVIDGHVAYTASRRDSVALNAIIHFGCPICRVWSEVEGTAAGAEVHCSNCRTVLRLNLSPIDADWRRIAEAWH